MVDFNAISNYFIGSGLGHIKGAGKGSKPAKTGEIQSAGYVQMTGSDSVKREDLDNLNPYSSMGLDIKKPEVTTETRIADVAQQDFGKFTGNYKLNNVQTANYDLADYRAKLNPEKFAAEYVNTEEVAAHLQNKESPFAELFT